MNKKNTFIERKLIRFLMGCANLSHLYRNTGTTLIFTKKDFKGHANTKKTDERRLRYSTLIRVIRVPVYSSLPAFSSIGFSGKGCWLFPVACGYSSFASTGLLLQKGSFLRQAITNSPI